AVRLLLLPEATAAHSVRTAAQHVGPVLHVRSQLRKDRVVVADEVELREPVVGPEDLVRVRDVHGSRTSSGRFSSRRPRYTGWRSFLSAVHSWNAICATSRGASQVAPFSRGGSVNGGVFWTSGRNCRCSDASVLWEK